MHEEKINGVRQESTRLKRFVSFAGRIITILSLVFLFLKLIETIRDVSKLDFGFNSVLIFIGSILFLIFLYLLLVKAWIIILQGGGNRTTFLDGYIIMGESQLSKYLPGNIFHYVQRVNLSVKYGVSSESCILSLGVETLLLATTAFCVSGVGLFLSGLKFSLLKNILSFDKFRSLSLIFLVILIIGIIAIVFSQQSRHWLLPRLGYLHPKRISPAAFLYALFFISIGFVISALLTTLWNSQSDLHWYDFSWGFTLAWLIGFIVPGSPGGIGIRETIFVTLFGKEIGEGVAVGLAVILRIITSISDIATYGIAWWLGRNK